MASSSLPNFIFKLPRLLYALLLCGDSSITWLYNFIASVGSFSFKAWANSSLSFAFFAAFLASCFSLVISSLILLISSLIFSISSLKFSIMDTDSFAELASFCADSICFFSSSFALSRSFSNPFSFICIIRNGAPIPIRATRIPMMPTKRSIELIHRPAFSSISTTFALTSSRYNSISFSIWSNCFFNVSFSICNCFNVC